MNEDLNIFLQNKESLKKTIEDTQKNCPEILNLFHVFAVIGEEYINILPEQPISVSYPEMNIKTSISLVQEFLKNIDYKYFNKFNEAIEKEKIKISEKNIPSQVSIEKGEDGVLSSSVCIGTTNTIKDGASLVHEFFHLINTDKQYIGVGQVFAELISIYYENRYFQFLVEKGFDSDILSQIFKDRMLGTKEDGRICFFAGAVLDVYKNKGDLTKINIKEMGKTRPIYLNYLKELNLLYGGLELKDLLEDFISSVSYLLGTILTPNLLENPSISDEKMKYLSEAVNRLTIQQVLNLLNTKIQDYPIWLENYIEKIKNNVKSKK